MAAVDSVILNEVKDLGGPAESGPVPESGRVSALDQEIRKALRALAGTGPFGGLRDPSIPAAAQAKSPCVMVSGVGEANAVESIADSCALAQPVPVL